MDLKTLAITVAERFEDKFPNPKTELTHKNEYELAVSVMLSAQTTDKKVNQITPGLFSKYPDWKSLAVANLEDIEAAIHGVNFHKGKADRLIKAGKLVSEKFNSVLPKDMDKLMEIPGVARKSANVIMQELWDIAEGIVVDTHVTRVSNKLGLTKEDDAKKIEKDLINLLPKKYWRNFSGACVLHGRYTCIARRPKCAECILQDVCPSRE
jgi:endonuclease III